MRAKPARCAWAYRWSSARAHVEERDDVPVRVRPLLDRVENWKEFLRTPEEATLQEELRKHERTGRPLGSEAFVKKLERLPARPLSRQKPGPKRKEDVGS